MAAVEAYVEGRLKLLVNREKSKGVPSMRELWVCFKYGDQAQT